MHPRSEVAGRFWPDVLDSSARKSLRTELVAVRRALGAEGEGVLVATRDMVGLVGDGLLVDAREFERLVRAGPAGGGGRAGRRRAAAGLDADWVYEARESHRQRLGDVLARLAADAEAAGALTDAIRISRRRVELDPLREDAHRELIRRLIAAGEVSAARMAFDDLAADCGQSCTCRPRERPVACSRAITSRRPSRPGTAAASRGAEPSRAQPVRRPRELPWLASGPVVRRSRWARAGSR